MKCDFEKFGIISMISKATGYARIATNFVALPHRELLLKKSEM